MANCVVTAIANVLQIFVWLPLLSAYGFLCGFLFNLLSCFRRPRHIRSGSGAASSSSASITLPQRIAGWCKQGPEGFGGTCGRVDMVGKAATACQSDSDKDDEFFNCAQMCFGVCANLGWVTTIVLSLPGCIVFTLRQACSTATSAAQRDGNGDGVQLSRAGVDTGDAERDLGSTAQNSV